MKTAVQIVAYALFAGFLGYFTSYPQWQLLEKDEAVVSLSFTHAAKRVGQCKRLSQEELLSLPPNMRKPDECPRERHPIVVEIVVNNEMIFQELQPPSGLWKDGKSSIYHRSSVAAGSHSIVVRMNDSGRAGHFDYEDRTTMNIAGGQNVVIYFDHGLQQFVFE